MEERTFKRTCDQCGSRLDDGGSWPNPTLIEVKAIGMGYAPSEGGSRMSFACVQYPVLSRAYHFCGLDCLQAFGWPGESGRRVSDYGRPPDQAHKTLPTED